MQCKNCGCILDDYIASNVSKGDFDQLCNKCAAEKWGVTDNDELVGLFCPFCGKKIQVLPHSCLGD